MSFLVTDVLVSFQWYILSTVTLITYSRGTLVNKVSCPNYIILNPWGKFILCLLFYFKVFLDQIKEDNRFSKYFASW